MESGKWKVESGKWKMESGKWEMESGKWEMESGKWKMESGKWKVENGKCVPAPAVVLKLTFVILSEAPARPLAGEVRNSYWQAGRIHFLKGKTILSLYCSFDGLRKPAPTGKMGVLKQNLRTNNIGEGPEIIFLDS